MDIILINSQGIVYTPYMMDEVRPVEVEDNIINLVKNTPDGKVWHYDVDTKTATLIDDLSIDGIRRARTKQCFEIIDNRSPLWFSHLSEEQQLELNNWYDAWLKATETKIIPKKPTWLE